MTWIWIGLAVFVLLVLGALFFVLNGRRMPTHFEERIALIRTTHQESPRGALTELEAVFDGVNRDLEPGELVGALTLLSKVAKLLGDPALASTARKAARAINSGPSLCALGNRLLAKNINAAARCVFTRARALVPGEESSILGIASSLEQAGRNEEACRVLLDERELCEVSFFCRYLLAFNTVLAGDLEAAAARERALRPDPNDEDDVALAERIADMLSRATLARQVGDLGHQDLRGWHFVTTGSLLLHLSPEGFDGGMNGRYSLICDSSERCRLGLERLGVVLQAWGAAPPRIFSLPDRDSQILALAAAKLFAVPIVDYDPDLPGLIVAYDLGNFDPATSFDISIHRPGQVLFAHATCWTSPPWCVADVTTFLYQQIWAPWGKILRISDDDDSERIPEDYDDDGSERIPEDDAPIATVAAKILTENVSAMNVPALERDSIDHLTAFALATRGGCAALVDGGRRSRLWEGSPVKSLRF